MSSPIKCYIQLSWLMQSHRTRVDSNVTTYYTTWARGMTSRLRTDDEQRRRSFAPETSHFFKIILSCTLHTGRLGIPKMYVRKYGQNLPETVRLRVPNGGSWRVELEKWDEMVWLSKGWKEFAEHYSIREGHFLVFKYVGDLDFHVLIFDKSATEIEYPLIDTVEIVPPKMEDADGHYNLESSSKLKGFRTDQEAKLLPPDSESRMENSKRKVSPAMLAARSSASKRSRVTSALQAANKYELQYPSFTAVIRSRTLLKQNVTVPGGFFKGRINGSVQTATLKHLDGSWPVKLMYYPQHGSGKLSAGWGAFQKGTSLKEGDVCVFELVRNDDIEFKVSIFRRNVET